MTGIDHITSAFTTGNRDDINRASADLYQTWLHLSTLISQRADSTDDLAFAEYLRGKAAFFDGAAEGIGGQMPRWQVDFSDGRPVRLHADTADAAKTKAARKASRRGPFWLLGRRPAMAVTSVAQVS